MLLYSTLLGIKDTMTKDDFIRLVIEWNQNQGNLYAENVIPDVKWNGERCIRFGNDNLWLEILEYRNKNIIAVRYEKITDNGVIWDTDYIMNFDEMKLSVRLDRSYIEEAVITQGKFSTPYFLKSLYLNNYIKPDGVIEFSLEPYRITGENVNILAQIVKGEIKTQLPVIYVSRTKDNELPVDISELSRRLKGVAHIFIQEDIETNDIIREACAEKNEYNGAIGVYYPNNALGHTRRLYVAGFESKIREDIIKNVMEYSALQKTDRLYTWQGVNNSLLMDRLNCRIAERNEAETARKLAECEKEKAENEKKIAESEKEKAENEKQIAESEKEKAENEKKIAESEKEKAKNEVTDVYSMFDEELESLHRQVEELTIRNEILENENQAYRSRLAGSDSLPILYQGEEKEIFQGEIKDIILAALADCAGKLGEDSRRRHVIDDVIENNNYEKKLEEKRQELKKVFTGYTKITSEMKQALTDLNFEQSYEGKHLKIAYNGDQRYLFTVGTTPNPGKRTDKNLIADINRIVF